MGFPGTVSFSEVNDGAVQSVLEVFLEGHGTNVKAILTGFDAARRLVKTII